MAVDRSVLDEVIAAIEPPDAEIAAAARARLAGAGALEPVAALAVGVSAMRRRVGPPVERKTIVAFAADLGDAPSCAGELRAAAAGTAPLAVLARAAGANMLLVDAGVRGAAEADLGPGVTALRAGDGAGDPASGRTMTDEQSLVAVQTGIALVLSLASEGVDVLAVGDLAPAGRAAAAGLARALLGALPPPPLAALSQRGGLQHGAIAGVCLAAAAIRVPVVLDGPSAAAAALCAARLAPAAAGYFVAAQAPGDDAEAAALAALALAPLAATSRRGDGSGAALVLPLVDAAARLAREIR
jgi:nicotinate-nucleotide--dimethylbenzimidazole phosphoribosyltransferase